MQNKKKSSSSEVFNCRKQNDPGVRGKTQKYQDSPAETKQ